MVYDVLSCVGGHVGLHGIGCIVMRGGWGHVGWHGIGCITSQPITDTVSRDFYLPILSLYTLLIHAHCSPMHHRIYSIFRRRSGIKSNTAESDRLNCVVNNLF